jgi:hypothetical protein
LFGRTRADLSRKDNGVNAVFETLMGVLRADVEGVNDGEVVADARMVLTTLRMVLSTIGSSVDDQTCEGE